jgi:putative SOS response-associated peptidase YedK
MCGRYDLDATIQELVARFGVPLRDVSVNLKVSRVVSAGVIAEANAGWDPKYNIAPSQHNPVLVRNVQGYNQLEFMQWGLVPAWSRQAKVPYSTINARAETVASKPAFRKPLATQRCLVPATGYFEWAEGVTVASANDRSQGSSLKQPYRIRLRGEGEGVDGREDDAGGSEKLARLNRIFAFAGLYDIWRGPGGEELLSYTIVTTKANDGLSAIHSRMPVILPRDIEEAWLDGVGDDRDIERLMSLLRPYPKEEMIAYPVSRLVNRSINDGRMLIEPLSRRAA